MHLDAMLVKQKYDTDETFLLVVVYNLQRKCWDNEIQFIKLKTSYRMFRISKITRLFN